MSKTKLLATGGVYSLLFDWAKKNNTTNVIRLNAMNTARQDRWNLR